MRFWSLFLIQLISTLAISQESKSISEFELEIAQKNIDEGKISLPNGNAIKSKTLQKLLEIDFNIALSPYLRGCLFLMDKDGNVEGKWYDQRMAEEIEKKWGKNFLKKQSKRAKHLDKQGLGFIEMQTNGVEDSLRSLLRREYWADLSQTNYFLIVSFNPDGSFQALMFDEIMDVLSEESKDYKHIKEAIERISPKISPSQFRGRSLPTTLAFYVKVN